MYSSSLNESSFNDICYNIQHYLINAVKKRVLITERPIACLLSGGLDSSLITALVNEEFKKRNVDNGRKLKTYSIGLEGSEDLKYAKMVAMYLGTDHTEVILTEKEFIDAIPEVIGAIESYDTTTVRASIGNYLLGKFISQNSEAKVIFNGDGSDELCGGYIYMHCCPDVIEFDRETRRLLKDIHLYDVLRSDKCISSHGLEPRTPFLDRSWVEYYLSIHPRIRFHASDQLNKKCEKFLLRTAFSKQMFLDSNDRALLPDSILWRKKEAFSDGVSGLSKSLYQILQDGIEQIIKIDSGTGSVCDSKCESLSKSQSKNKTKEQQYYRSIFDRFYPNADNVVPYLWMPKYVESSDPSARSLKIYDSLQ